MPSCSRVRAGWVTPVAAGGVAAAPARPGSRLDAPTPGAAIPACSRKFRRASAGSRRNSMILSPMRYSNLQQVAWTRPRHDAPEEEVGLLSAARKLCTCFAAARERFGRCRTSVGRYRPHLPDLAFDLL